MHKFKLSQSKKMEKKEKLRKRLYKMVDECIEVGVGSEYILISKNDYMRELEKAREEGYQDCLDDIWEEAKGLRGWTEHDGNVSATDIEAGLQEAYLNIEENRKEVSI